MKSNFILILLICLVAIACSNKKEVSYHPPIFEKYQDLSFEIINDSALFRTISYMAVYDSLLIICDPSLSNVINIFNKKNGSFLMSAGKVGGGPGELITPVTFSFDGKNGDLYVFDEGKKSVISFNIGQIMNENLLVGREMRVQESSSSVNGVYFLKDSLFIANGYPAGIMVSAMGVNSLSSIIPEGPVNVTEDEWAHFNALWSISVAKPDGTCYALATILGGILDIYSIDGNSIRLGSKKYFYEPIYDKRGAIISLNEKTTLGFCSLCATNDYLYATVHGKTNPIEMPRAIWKFDWTGDPVERYDCNYSIENFIVDDSSRQIYASVYKNGELILVKGSCRYEQTKV